MSELAPPLDEAYRLVLEASSRLAGVAVRTPVVESEGLNEVLGRRVLLKCENLQRICAFKFRGAYNAISQLSDEELQRGVIAYSSGNHAQAVALAARLLGTQATIVMPQDAPRVKRTGVERMGAEVVYFDPQETTREEVAAQVNSDGGKSLIKPFDDIRIIAGQGTAALELIAEHPDIDLVMVPCGGAGLLSGTAIACKGIGSDASVVGVEPELADDATRTFCTGELQTVHNPPTIADGTRTHSVGQITYQYLTSIVDDMVTVGESSIIEAVRLLFETTRMVVEPSGALGIAALLERGVSAETSVVGIVLSGGNIDPELYGSIISGQSPRELQ